MQVRLPGDLFGTEGTLFGRSDRIRIGSGTGRTVRRKTFIFPLVIFVVTVLIGSCDDSARQERSLGTGVLADQEFTDFVTMESDSGVVQWKLVAPVARVYDARNLLVTESPTISFFDETGEVSSVLTADKAEYNRISHDLTALGNVVVTSREGYILETESLVWLNTVEQIHTEDFVKVTRGKDILTGYGFQGYPELKNIDIKRDVRAWLKDDDGLVDEEIEKERAGSEE